MLTRSKLAGFAVIGAIWLPAAATAQEPSVDPQADSPAGTIYKLPLDSARGDAAPKRPAKSAARDRDSGGSAGGAGGGGSGGGTGGGGATGSAIHSENGFGSSDVVPGAANPSGTRGAGSGTAGVSTKTAHADDPSSAGVYLLLGLVLLVAVAIGLATRGRGGPVSAGDAP